MLDRLRCALANMPVSEFPMEPSFYIAPAKANILENASKRHSGFLHTESLTSNLGGLLRHKTKGPV